MAPFPDFTQRHGPPAQCVQVPAAVIKKYAQRLPGVLLDHWQAAGWCAYSKGLLWITDPAQFQPTVKDWFPKDKTALVFARTAFGDLFVWRGGRIVMVLVQSGRTQDMGDDIEILLDGLMCDEAFVRDALWPDTLDFLLAKFGPLSADECFAPVPALALGGSDKPEAMQKVKLREHLALLRQLH